MARVQSLPIPVSSTISVCINVLVGLDLVVAVGVVLRRSRRGHVEYFGVERVAAERLRSIAPARSQQFTRVDHPRRRTAVVSVGDFSALVERERQALLVDDALSVEGVVVDVTVVQALRPIRRYGM